MEDEGDFALHRMFREANKVNRAKSIAQNTGKTYPSSECRKAVDMYKEMYKIGKGICTVLSIVDLLQK